MRTPLWRVVAYRRSNKNARQYRGGRVRIPQLCKKLNCRQRGGQPRRFQDWPRRIPESMKQRSPGLNMAGALRFPFEFPDKIVQLAPDIAQKQWPSERLKQALYLMLIHYAAEHCVHYERVLLSASSSVRAR